MASSVWRTNRTLNAVIREQYGRFNAHQLVRLLHWRQQDKSGKTPAPHWDIGQRFRFRADLSARFAGQEISSLLMGTPDTSKRLSRLRRKGPAPEVVEISTPNYCLASSIGPLPDSFIEWVREQSKEREHAMAHFLDLFNQRLNVARFELKARQSLALNNLPPEQTPHAGYLAALMGFFQPELGRQIPLPRRAWLALAGLLSNCRKSGWAAARVMSFFLGAEVTLTEMVGAWQKIEEADRIALGQSRHSLGVSAVLGRRVWDQQARVRLKIAPLEYPHFCRLLPPDLRERFGAPAKDSLYEGFVALLRLLLDRLCDCEVVLQVKSATIPPSVLTGHPRPSGEGTSYYGLRLAQTAWLRIAPDDKAGIRSVRFIVPAYDAARTIAEAA